MRESKEIYLQNLKKHHKTIEIIIEQNYDIKTRYLEVLSWGYTTTAFYIKTENDSFIVRLSTYSVKKEQSMRKEITLSQLLKPTVPCCEYIKARNGGFMLINDDKILRISKYIEGVPPFDFDPQVLNQTVNYLKMIHKYNNDALQLPYFENTKGKNYKLLHGDLTPSNILISYGKIVGILDFELAIFGPIEWDLSRTAVFFWFRTDVMPFDTILNQILGTYRENEAVEITDEINANLLLEFSQMHLESHLNNIRMNKNDYDNLSEWEHDCNFAADKLKKLTTYTKLGLGKT